MTERERLINLLKSPHKAEQLRQMGVSIGNYEDDCIEAMVADFLLAKGVIVPPCKVGDTVYTVIFKSKFIRSDKVVGFHLGKFPTLRGHARKEYLVCYNIHTYSLSHIDIAQIGKTVFLTKEEAEKALAERSNR
jgi:hypothetical protein